MGNLRLVGCALLVLAACAEPTAAPDADRTSEDASVVDASVVDAARSVDAGSDAHRDDAAMPDVGAPDAAFVPGPHAPFTPLTDQGGPRMAHPALVTITFAGDTRRAALEDYASWIVGSSWLLAVGGDYGVGSGTVGGTVVRPETAPATITDAEIQTFLATGILDHSIPTPPVGLAETIFLLYYPPGTVITVPGCGPVPVLRSCEVFGGYHQDAHVMGVDFAYAVMPACPSMDASLTDVEAVEHVASHEIIEAASDPFPLTDPAFLMASDPTSPLLSFLDCGGVENADLCELTPAVTREAGHVAQRSWSNSAAAAGADPCVPANPALPYFNVTASPATVQHVAAGSSVDYVLDAWSTAAIPAWTLQVGVIGPGLGTAAPLSVTPRLSRTTVNNGQSVTLHVAVDPGAAPGTAYVFIDSSRSPTDRHVALVAITSP